MTLILTVVILLIVRLVAATDKTLRSSFDETILSETFHLIDGNSVSQGRQANFELANHMVESNSLDPIKYSISFSYSDGACTSMTTAVALRINQCYKISGNYTMTTVSVVKTMITTTRTRYQDSVCTKVLGTPISKSVSSACSSGGSEYRQASIASIFSFPSANAGILIK